MKIEDVVKRASSDPQKFDAKVKKALLKGPKTLVELADKFSVPPKMIEAAVARLQEAKHNVKLSESGVEISGDLMQGGPRLMVNSRDFFDGKFHKFGALGDTHLAS